MKVRPAILWAVLPAVLTLTSAPLSAQQTGSLPGTTPLQQAGDLSAQMVEGIHTFLSREIDRSLEERPKSWSRDFSSRMAYERSIGPNREQFRKLIGAVDARVPIAAMEFIGSTVEPAVVAETGAYTVQAVRWPVFEGVWGEDDLRRRAKDLAAEWLRRFMRVPDDHHAPYPEEVLAELPLARLPSPVPLIDAVHEAGWSAVRIKRLRDVEWAAKLHEPWPLGSLEQRPRYTLVADA